MRQPRRARRSLAPLVSVVTACHDAAEWVGETIASVLAQTHPAVEHVVVDDGSTDASWEVISALAAQHPGRVRAVRLGRNRGGCHARNRGAAEARGDFLLFLDADDVVAPETVAALVDAAVGAPGALAVCEWAYLRRDGDGWREGRRDVRLPPVDSDDALRGWLEGRAWVPPCVLLWPRAVFEATGGWDESLARNQDGDIAMRALAEGAPVTRAAGGRGFYRQHGAARVSVSRNFVSEEKFGSAVRVLDNLLARLEGQGRVERFARSLGFAYQQTAWRGFQQGFTELGRECERRGLALAGGRLAVSPRRAGRLLERVVGLERKEALVQRLARIGITTAGRRTVRRLRQAAAGGGAT